MKSWSTVPRWLRWLNFLVVVSVLFTAWDVYIVHSMLQQAAERQQLKAEEQKRAEHL